MRIRFHTLALAASFAAPSLAAAQPSLSSLWPHADAIRWDYDITIADAESDPPTWSGDAVLRFDGTVDIPGGTAQNLVATHPIPTGKSAGRGLDPLLAAVWRARPDLRRAIEARYGDRYAGGEVWFPILLHDGGFQETPSALLMWQPEVSHPTWTYTTSDLTVGAEFTQQLVPELADDVFLHGTVESIDATVMTPAATFEHVVRIGYRIDYGWNEDPSMPFGRFRPETRGHVHFAPDTGPVEMHEEFIGFAEIDCGMQDCPISWMDLLGDARQIIDMALTSTTVGVSPSTFTQVKTLYR